MADAFVLHSRRAFPPDPAAASKAEKLRRAVTAEKEEPEKKVPELPSRRVESGLWRQGFLGHLLAVA